MSILSRCMTIIATYLPAAVPRFSPTATRSFSGTCRAGVWTFRITYDDITGVVSSMNGARCGVVLWSNPCTVAYLRANPGTDSSYLIEGGSGWWIRMNVEAEGRVTRVWGESAGGEYYVVDSEDDVADYY